MCGEDAFDLVWPQVQECLQQLGEFLLGTLGEFLLGSESALSMSEVICTRLGALFALMTLGM